MSNGVLVVEDDPDLREMMAQLLRLEGFDPVVAENGRDALKVLRSGARPDVILLDLMMPIMDGWQFRREQQSDRALADIPVVVATAVPLERVTSDFHAAAVLQKPLDLDDTIQTIRRHC
jgi:CheY-like chemotaxis protein